MSKVVVVHLWREKLAVFKVIRGEKIAKAEVDWNKDNIAEKFALIKEKFETDKVRVLLADGVAYLWVRPIKEGEAEPSRDQLEQEMKSEFPEAVGSMWDYALSSDENGKVALVFAPVKEVFEEIVKGASEAKVKIEDVEPERFARRRGEDAVIEIAKKSLKGKDEDILSMKVEVVDQLLMNDDLQAKVDGLVKNKLETTPLKQKKSIKLKPIIVIGGGVLLLISLILGGVWRAKNALKVESQQDKGVVITPLATPSATPEPSVTPIAWNELKIKVLNGSGVAGKAGEVKDLLIENLGVEGSKVKTGNADNYDYDGVEVAVKGELSEEVYTQIESLFADSYDVIQTDDLTSKSEYDVVIIVGKQLIDQAEKKPKEASQSSDKATKE